MRVALWLQESVDAQWSPPAKTVSTGLQRVERSVFKSMAHSLLEILSDVSLGESEVGEHQEEEEQQLPNEIVVVLEEERSTEVISLDSSEQSFCSSPRPSKDLIAYEVMVNQRNIEDVCICCGSLQIHTQHPLFDGGMCIPCKDNFLESFFLYDEDGYQSFCTICCSGEILLTCENPNCNRSYCFECVDALVNPGSSAKFQAMSNWKCFLCLPLISENGLLKKRRKWREHLKDFYDRESQRPLKMYKTVPAWKRKPIQVLSLFGDIEEELVKFGFLEDSSGNGRLKHLDDVTDVVRKDVEEWGPFDLIYGSTPPIGQISEHPPVFQINKSMRKITYHFLHLVQTEVMNNGCRILHTVKNVWYFLQYYRVLQYGKPKMDSEKPFFWMFVDNLVLTEDDKEIASRFLESDPVTIYEVCDEMVQNAVLIWSNIPSMESNNSALASDWDLSLLAQDIQRLNVFSPWPSRLVNKCFIPLREYFKCFPKDHTP
ncbi:DNA (cytosine-5)-methyltransferase 3-like [Dromiciops gliroides]|uniref:DNA (cytosine-5)-methyltransferase 3-like n=1 Tax=Dromiciops gliroides TaxID=33562 RepID=UPI001CC339D6|nr:DNA (cytosine-5)-methyltransferase 3-like [Dromiciops gliroides]